MKRFTCLRPTRRGHLIKPVPETEKKKKKQISTCEKSQLASLGIVFSPKSFKPVSKKKKVSPPGTTLLQTDGWFSPKFLHNGRLFGHVEAIIPCSRVLWVQFQSLSVSQLENDRSTHKSRIAIKQYRREQVSNPFLTTVRPPRCSETKVGGQP